VLDKVTYKCRPRLLNDGASFSFTHLTQLVASRFPAIVSNIKRRIFGQPHVKRYSDVSLEDGPILEYTRVFLEMDSASPMISGTKFVVLDDIFSMVWLDSG